MRVRGSEVGRRVLLAWLAVAVASPAAAQTRPPGPGGPAIPPARLVDDAAPAARILTDEDGRIRRAWGLAIAVDGASPEARARAFLRRYAGELALAPGARLAAERRLEVHGRTVVRFARRAFGGPVLGGSVVVRLRGRAVDYVALVGVSAAPAAAARRVGEDEAVAAARRPGERALSVSPAAFEREGALVPVWQVDLAGDHRHQRRRAVVDAADGAVLLSHPLLRDALGRVYESDPTTDASMTTDVELPHLTSRERLTGRYFRVESCNAGERGCDPAQLAEADADGNFLFDPEEPAFDDPFAEVHTYFHANVVAAYFREAHDFTWTCGERPLMRAFVNYTEAAEVPFENAAYSPTSGSECGYMLFGQGAERDFAYDADVVYHEYGHAVADGTSGLGFFLVDPLGVSYEPGALNEGTADYFAATVSGDPRMAEYFMGSGVGGTVGALRRLDNELVCPDDLVGQQHLDGRIWAALGWDLREILGPEKADALFFSTLAAFDMIPSFAGATETLLATADAMLADERLTPDDRAAVDAAVEARGLLGCERVAPLDDGAMRLAYSGQEGLTPAAGGSIAPVHYRIDVPPDATALRVRIERLTPNGTYRLYSREGAPVRFVASRRPPLLASGEHAPDARGEVVIDRDSDPPLPRCETLYLAVVTEDLRTAGPSLYQVSAELERSGLDEPCTAPDAGVVANADAGADAGPGVTPAGGGCGCRALGARDSSGAGLAAALALAAWVARRRRR